MHTIRALLVALLFCGQAFAAEFEGVAPLGMDGVPSARQNAILDALDNASLAFGAEVKGQTQHHGGKSADALRVRGQPVGDYAVVREWTTHGFYHVVLNVQPALTPAAAQANRACTADYRRKALITRMPVLHPGQATDLIRITDEMQNELLRRLDAGGQFLAQRTHNEAALLATAGQNEPEINPDWIRDLARRYGVQFVVGGVLRDVGFDGERYSIGYGNDIRTGERKAALNIPLLEFARIGVKSTPDARRFELDLFVFDGVSGAQIQRQRLSGRAEGDVLMDQSTSVGSEHFFTTDYGKLVDTKLSEATKLIADAVQCIPFSARITRVESGRLIMDAGATSRLAPGDKLQVYRLKTGSRVAESINFNRSAQLGWLEEIAGTVTIKDVQPLFSVGLPEGLFRVEVGDYVRFIGAEGKK